MSISNISPTAMTALFLQQSLLDSKDDWRRSISLPSFPRWDAVIITASNDLQAEGYRKQIEYRKSLGRLPAKTEFIIVPDEGGRRVGSAGSTLSVIRELKSRYGSLDDRRFLCIHAGGDSKRCPQYSALGKLFSPIPCDVDGVPATLFDMFMISMASVPGRLKEGMLLLSGDVILLFNPLMCDFGSSSAAVISFKENAETGKNHGVYLRGESGNVRRFLHKQSVETLTALGAVDERGNCSIDTGAIWLCPQILDRLYSLVDTDAKYAAIVNDRVRLSLYGDIAYCLAEDSSLDEFYREKPEGKFCDELTEARSLLWNAIGQYNMRLLNLAPAKFVHFGSIPEILRLMTGGVNEYASLGWRSQINSSISRDDVAGYNSVFSEKAEIGPGCYLEVSYVHSAAKIGSGCLLSFVDIHDETIPDDSVVHALKQMNGSFVCRIFGTTDNPKSAEFFGRDLETLAARTGISPEEIWDEGDEHTLWNAKLYPEEASIREALAASLNVCAIFDGGGDLDLWRRSVRKSLCSGFNEADVQAIIDWSKRMEELVRMDALADIIREGRPVTESKKTLRADKLSKIQTQWLERHIESLNCSDPDDFSFAMRLWYYLGAALSDEEFTSNCFSLIADTVLNATVSDLKYNENARMTAKETVVHLPLRVNFGGGWSDTAPHCIERGGTVLNAAISLAGELPVEVRLVRIPEKKIVFDSRDMDVHGEFDTIAPLQRAGDPYDPFALQKACLLACGIIPKEGGELGAILDRLGGGFEMHSEVTNVPKGSGLGTSSILSAAAVKAVFEFMGIDHTEDDLYSTVLAMEQIMSTGGGWQDQVGGVTPGFKFITSEPGISQHIKVEKLELSDRTKRELDERFCLIYTGQRRLARNLLRDVVGRYVGNIEESLFAHREIQKTASDMRDALLRGDVDEFAALLDRHWSLSLMIDEGSTNTLIDQIFMSIDDLISAKMVCGAGGGGFLQVILRRGVTKDDVHRRLKDVFQDFAVDVWDSGFIY